MWRELTMPSATPARTVADRCRKATFKAPGSIVRGTVRISTSKPALLWGRQRRRAIQVTKSWSKAMTSKWKYRISVRAVILSLSYFFLPYCELDQRERFGRNPHVGQPFHYGIIVCDYSKEFCRLY